jgi:uncharacterized damage-inducible protein DinB
MFELFPLRSVADVGRVSRVNHNGMFLDPAEDPRVEAFTHGERETVLSYLTNFRLTLEVKCRDLTPEQLAMRSVPPSDMSLLGLVRHMGRVEQHWFRRVMEDRLDLPRLRASADDTDLSFVDAVGTAECVEDAFAVWEAEIAHADAYIAAAESFDVLGRMNEGPVELRDILVHMIEEYARHCGHADLLRECIDGRTGA